MASTSTDLGATPGVSRRGPFTPALGGAAGLAIGTGAGAAAGVAIGRVREHHARASVHDFYGAHQAGITAAVQDHLHFASFDMMPRTDRNDLVTLLQD